MTLDFSEADDAPTGEWITDFIERLIEALDVGAVDPDVTTFDAGGVLRIRIEVAVPPRERELEALTAGAEVIERALHDAGVATPDMPRPTELAAQLLLPA
jgi:hypothetical protein